MADLKLKNTKHESKNGELDYLKKHVFVRKIIIFLIACERRLRTRRAYLLDLDMLLSREFLVENELNIFGKNQF